MFLANGACSDRSGGMSHVYKRFSCEVKASRHMSAQEEGLTMPSFNPFGLSDQKKQVKMISSNFWGLCDTWHLSEIFMTSRHS